MTERKLVTIRTIAALDPIPGADAIEVATIDGWQVVVKKGDFEVGDDCLYFEIDSFLPDGEPAWQFLVDKSSCIFNGARGHRLRTIKLRGQISQGLALRTDAMSGDPWPEPDTDLAEWFGVTKWERPISPQLAGLAKGNFPSFIPKTDQERCQNIGHKIFGEYCDTEYEVTIKLDGSSMTVYHNNGHVGVCSRNLELKIEGNEENAFVRMFLDSGLAEALPKLGNVAIQGELMGPGIQGNREGLVAHKFFVFDVYDIDAGRYLTAAERCVLWVALAPGLTDGLVMHVPSLDYVKNLDQAFWGDRNRAHRLAELGAHNMQALLALADGPSINNPIREGLVFKSQDGRFSFKAISNKFLAGEKD